MNKAFIYDKNGVRYEFKPLTYKKTLEYQKKVMSMGTDKEVSEEKLEKTIEIFKDLFKNSNPEYDMEMFDEDVIEYNFNEFGLEGLYEIIGFAIEEAFSPKREKSVKEIYPFLQKTQESEQMN